MTELTTFKLKDPLGRTVTFEKRAQKHIARRHKEIKLAPTKVTIISPHFIYPSGKDPKSDLYYRRGADEEHPQMFYKIVVRFDTPSEGTVVTGFMQFTVDDAGRPKYVNIHQ